MSSCAFHLMQHYREIEWELTELAIAFEMRGWRTKVFTDPKTGLPTLCVKGSEFVAELKTPDRWKKRAILQEWPGEVQ